jgi:RNA polymerase sigma-70 factor (ECF subfamily)
MNTGPPAPTDSSVAATATELADLLRRVAARDSSAFATLYKHTRAKLHGVIARILTRGDLSGEVLQEVFVRIWEKAADYDVDKGSPIAWMATIARNRALDEVRRVRPVSLEDMPEGFEPAPAIGPSACRR